MTADVVAVHGRANVPVELPVARGPVTGYVWRLHLPPGVVQVADAPGAAPPVGKHLGGASGAMLQVQAPPGRYRITAVLARPWEQKTPASTVIVDLTIE